MLKRYISILCFAVLLLSCIMLAGCQSTVESADSTTRKIKKNTMISSELTTRESYIINLLDQFKAIVSEYRVTDKFKEVHVWMEEYRNGELVETTGLGGKAAGTMGSIIISIDNGGNLVHYIESDGSRIVHNTYPVQLEFPTEFGKGMISWLSPDSSNIIADHPVLIAVIRYKDSSSFFELPSNDFYQNYRENINEISDCEITYIIACRFSTEWTPVD